MLIFCFKFLKLRCIENASEMSTLKEENEKLKVLLSFYLIFE